MGLPARDEACSLPSLRYLAVSIGCVNKVHSPRGVHDMCESGRGSCPRERACACHCVYGGGSARACACVCVCGGGGVRVR